MIVVAALLAFRVVGASPCPAPELVEHRVRPLLGETAARHTARLERSGGSVTVEIVDEAGAVLAQRRLDAGDASCDDLVGAVAVVIAALEADWRASAEPTLRLRAPAEPALPPPPPRAGLAWAIEAAALAEAPSGGAPSPGGAVALRVGRARARWELEASLLATGTHARAVGRGEGRWRRASAGLGAAGVLARGRWSARLGVEALASWVRVEGSGFDVTRSDDAVEPGLLASPRIAVGGARWAVWAGALALWHPLDRVLSLENQPDVTARVPKLELGGAVGVTWWLRR